MSSLLGSLTVLISASTVGFAKAAREIRTIDRAAAASTAGMSAGIAATGNAAKVAGNNAAAASAAATASAKQTNAAMMSVGRTMTQFVTLPLGILGIVAAKTFSDFEYSLAKITGLVGIASDQTKQWGEKILRMSSAVGKGPTELAEALYFITSSGFKTTESLEILNTSAKAAAAGLGETKTVANVVTSALNAYKQSSLSAAEATDILVNTVREGKGEADQMVASMGVILPISSKLGVSFDEVGAAMAAMTRTGSTAATSAVQLRQILFTLLKPAKHSRDALAAMGTSSQELRKTLREDGLLATLMEVKRLIDTFGEETTGEIFPNIRALSGTLEIIGENLEDNKKIFESLANSTGMADKAFEAVSETYKFKLRAAFAEGSVMMVRFGEAIARVLIPALEGLQRIFKDVGDWFNGLSESTQNFIVKAAGIAVVLGPLIALRSAFLTMKMAIAAPIKALFGLTAATQTQTAATVAQDVANTKASVSMFRKALADEAAAVSAQRLATLQKVQVATINQAATAQVRAEVAAFEYAKAQMAAGQATAFAAKTQEFAARTQINAATAQQIAKEKIIAMDSALIKAEDAVARAQALAATATRNGVFAAEALAYAKQQEAAAVTEAAAAEARAMAIIKSGTVVTLSQRTATTQAAVALEAATLAKRAEVAATESSAAAKQAESLASYKQQRATALAAAAARAEAAAMEANTVATQAATLSKVEFAASTERSLLFGKRMAGVLSLQGMAMQNMAAMTKSAIIPMNGVSVQTMSASKAALMNIRVQARQAAAARATAAALQAQAAATKQAAVANSTFTAYSGGSLLMAKNAQFATKAVIAQNTAMVGTGAAAAFTAPAVVKTTVAMGGLKAVTLATTRVMQGLLASMAANPWTWIIGAGIAVYALVKHLNKLTEVEQLQKDVTDKVADAVASETAQLNGLLAVAQNEYIAKQTRLDAIKRINEISPLYLSNVSEETIRTGEAKKAIDEYNESLAERLRISALQESMIEVEKEYTKAVIDGSNKRVKGWQKAGLVLSSPFNIKDWVENNDSWKKTIKEREKINADSAKNILAQSKSYIANELADRSSITEQITRQYDVIQKKIAQVTGKEKEYQALLGKTGKDRTDAIKRAGEDFAKRLLKGGEGNTEADLIKEIGEGQQEILIATYVELETLLNSMVKEKELIEKSLQKFGVQSKGFPQGPLKDKPEIALPGIGGTYGLNMMKQFQDLPKINSMIEDTSVVMRTLKKDINESTDLGEASFDLAKFNKDLKDLFSTLERESKLFKDFDYVNEKLKVYEKALKDVAEAKDININSKWIKDLKLQYETLKVASDAMKDMAKEQEQLASQFDAQMEVEFQAQKRTDDLAASLLNGEVMVTAYQLSLQGLTNATYDSTVEFEQFQKIIKELEKVKGFMSPEVLADFEKLKSMEITWDINEMFKNVGKDIDSAGMKAKIFGKYWDGAAMQLDVYQEALNNAMRVNLSGKNEKGESVFNPEQLAQYIAYVDGLKVKIDALTETDRIEAFGNSIMDLARAFESIGDSIKSAMEDGTVSFAETMNIISQGILSIIPLYLAWASSAMIAKEAQKGVVGILTAAAGIAAIIGLFAKFVTPNKMKDGGKIPPGYPNDTFPALLTSGEMVVPVDKVNTVEKALQEKKGVLKLAGGGIVGKDGGVESAEKIYKPIYDYSKLMEEAGNRLETVIKAFTGQIVEVVDSQSYFMRDMKVPQPLEDFKNLPFYEEYQNLYAEKQEAYNFRNSFYSGNRPDNIKVNDTRNVPSDKKMSHGVNDQTVRDIVSKSIEKQLDPLITLAMSLQETGISNWNPMHNNAIDAMNISSKDSFAIAQSLDFLVKKFDWAEKLGKTSEAEKIQSWNGFGKVFNYEKQMYGTSETIDMNKNPVFGQRVQALRDSAIMTTPEIMKIIHEEIIKYGITKEELEKSLLINKEQLTYDKGLTNSLTNTMLPSDKLFKEQKPLFDLSRFGIGKPVTAMTGETSGKSLQNTIGTVSDKNKIPSLKLDDTTQSVAFLSETVQSLLAVFGTDESVAKFFGGIEKGTEVLTGLSSVLTTVKQLSAVFKAAQSAQAAATAAGIPATVGAAAAQETLAIANTNAAVTGAAASVSWIPIVGVALAIAGVAAMIAMLVSNKKKATKMAGGGVVPAGFPNDTFPALLTSGEMVVPPMKLPNINLRKEKQEVTFIIEGRVIKGIMKDAETVSKAY